MVKTVNKIFDNKIVDNKVIENKNIKANDNNYGLLFAELDSMYGERNYVLAYGDLKKVQFYKEDCRLKGEVLEYKTQAWLVKKIEKIKGTYKDSVKVLFID